MTSLRELQVAFIDGTLHGYPAQINSLIAASALAPEARVSIYANNAREGFLNALAATFPVIERLAGQDWFRQTGREYMQRCPSRSGNLHYVGERFAAFLDDALRDTDYAYFADVARLEWAYQEVLVAADHPSFDLSALSGVSPDALRFAGLSRPSGAASGRVTLPGARDLESESARGWPRARFHSTPARRAC